MKGKHIAIPFLSLIPIWGILGLFVIGEDSGFGVFILWLVCALATIALVISVIAFFIREGWDENLSDLTFEDYKYFIGLD